MVVHIPPNLPYSVYADFSQTAEEGFGYNNDNILLLGNLNLLNNDWTGYLRAVDESSRCIIDLANLYDLRQLNRVLNFRGVLLDLVFSSFPDTEVVPALDSFLPEDRYHPALEITIAVPKPVRSDCIKLVYDFRKCNIREIFNQIQALKLPTSDNLLDVEHSFNLFCDQLYLIITQNTPMKRIV